MTQEQNQSQDTRVINGKEIASRVMQDVKAALENEKSSPGLAVLLVGNDPASESYVGMKIRACQKVGIQSHAYNFGEQATEAEIIELIKKLNSDNSIHGILVQLPLPKHIDTNRVCNTITSKKDVDGLTASTLGNIVNNSEEKLLPCTPRGIIHILQNINLKLTGINCTIVGASTIVGKPLAMELINRGATVTICHKDTIDLARHIKHAELLITAIGKPGVINSDWIQPGCTLIDIGISKIDGKICGDLDFTTALPKSAKITPVPGGVGPITVAMLMKNTLEAFLNR